MISLLEPLLSDFREDSLAWLIQKAIDESHQPGGRAFGLSKGYTLRRLQKAPITAKIHTALKPTDFIDHCKARRAAGALPQTIQQDMTYLSGILKHAFEIWEMPNAGLLAYKKAKPELDKQQLIGKSEPRIRLPAEEELAQLRAYFTEQNENPRTKIDMVTVMDAELLTGRRISELCRIERQHVNVEKRTCWVYNLKNAKGKGYHAEFALIEGAWELFERRLAAVPINPQARLFPWAAKSCGIRYTLAKNALGIKGLHMHDNRALCFVRLLDKGYSSLQVRKGISLHRNPNIFENTYARIKAESLHDGPAAERA